MKLYPRNPTDYGVGAWADSYSYAHLCGSTAESRLRCRFSRGGQRRQVPLGVSMTMMGYFRRCHGRSSFVRGGSLVLDLLVERCAIGLRRVPPSVLIVPRPFPAKAVPKARCTSITTPTIA